MTGIPACLKAGTPLTLAAYYAPLAAALSAVTFPLGRALGLKLSAWARVDRAGVEVWSLGAGVAAVCLFLATVLWQKG